MFERPLQQAHGLFARLNDAMSRFSSLAGSYPTFVSNIRRVGKVSGLTVLIVAKRSGGRFAELVKSRGPPEVVFRRRRHAGRPPVVAGAATARVATAAGVF